MKMVSKPSQIRLLYPFLVDSSNEKKKKIEIAKWGAPKTISKKHILT